MSFTRKLIFVELAALAALIIVSAAMAVYGTIDSMLHTRPILDPASSARIGFGYTAIVGAVPALLFGGPIYVGLLCRNFARWPYVLLLGTAPGVLALAFDTSLGFFAIICGASVASLTHLMCSQLGLNKSLNTDAPKDGAPVS